MRRLNDNLLLLFTGRTRKSDKILAEQKQNIKDRESVLGEMKDIAYQAREALLAGNVDAIGELLHESWLLKKQLASRISNPDLDAMYEAARQAGAVGGKISGAGGGGFMLLYCRNGTQERVREALDHLQELPFSMNQDGSKVIFDYQR
jgi:D-glycero-alpha-D-manno-heptose-7-phosphate kinase